MSDDRQDEEESTPLQDLRPFYRSRARQDLTFLPAGSLPGSIKEAESSSRTTAADTYLSIVFKDDKATSASTPSAPATQPASCAVCHLPLSSTSESSPHEASLAHQLCLAHSHPPSHLDRKHVGLRYLSAHGWDPDSRSGLGAQGTGIRVPVKAVEKKNTAGIGFSIGKKSYKNVPVRRETLDAKKMRKLSEKERKRDQGLRDLFYRDEKINQYLSGE